MRLYQSVAMLGFTLCIGFAGAFAQSPGEVVKPASSRFKIFGQTIRQLQKDAKGFYKGDFLIYGIPNKPARLDSPELSLSARTIIFGVKNRNIVADGEPGFVTIKGKIVPKLGGLPLRFEATCRAAAFDGKKGMWTLEEDVKGWYETAKGRKPLGGDMVTLSRLASTVSITQETTENAGGYQ